MSNKPNTPDNILKNLIDVLSDAAMAQPDDEIIAQAVTEHGNVEAHVASLKAALAARLAAKRKDRLVRARAALNHASAVSGRQSRRRPLPELKETARALFAQRSDLPERLTVAFRSGEAMSDDDWSSLIDDLVELGFLSDE
jgi:hypothetical protein